MDRQSHCNGLASFFEHWGIFITVAIAVRTGNLLTFSTDLRGAPWIWLVFAAFSLMLLGAGLIGYSKLPVYRSGRFFAFGSNSIPQHLLRYYLWGWRLFLFGVVLAICLLLSRP